MIVFTVPSTAATLPVVVMFVIYDSPSDYPGKYVVRRWCIAPGGEVRPDADPTATTYTLRQARSKIPSHYKRMARHPYDDACIVEVWL